MRTETRGRKSPAPAGWITVSRVSIDYGYRGNRQLVIKMARKIGIRVYTFHGAKCLRIRELPDLLKWIDDVWQYRMRLD